MKNINKSVIKITGKLIFDPSDITKKHKSQSTWKKVAYLKIDGDLGNYYRWYLNKNHGLVLNPSVRGDHITFISDRFDSKSLEFYNTIKKKYNNKKLSIEIDVSNISTNGKYWWFNIQDTKFFENIRNSCGFSKRPYHGFHLTIGYPNDRNLDHSFYVKKTFDMFKL